MKQNSIVFNGMTTNPTQQTMLPPIRNNHGGNTSLPQGRTHHAWKYIPTQDTPSYIRGTALPKINTSSTKNGVKPQDASSCIRGTVLSQISTSSTKRTVEPQHVPIHNEKNILPSIKANQIGRNIPQKDFPSCTKGSVLPEVCNNRTETIVSPQVRSEATEGPAVDRQEYVKDPINLDVADLYTCLTLPEKIEIKDYKSVWYLGNMKEKSLFEISKEYKRKDGHYKVLLHDHLAYRYEILEVIGRGYTGVILKCKDHKTEKLVAIKVMRKIKSFPSLGNKELEIQKTLQEINSNNTANIVHMRESFYFRGRLCIVYDLYEKDLRQALKDRNNKRFSEKETRIFTKDVLKCLLKLKENKIVHGDLNMENILLRKEGDKIHAAVCDFEGSVFANEKDKPISKTLNYTAPEALLDKKCDSSIDMWSLGCILAELHLGQPLFTGSNDVELFDSIMKVQGVPKPELLGTSDRRNLFFDTNGVPLNISRLKQERTFLKYKLNTRNEAFLDFIGRCLIYDPTWRLTPEKALKHPWICGKKMINASSKMTEKMIF